MSKEKLCVATLIPTKKLDKFGFKKLETSVKDLPCFELQPSKGDVLMVVKELLKTFDKVLILQKLGDYSENELSRSTKEILKSTPGIVWLDDPSRSSDLSNRWTMYQLIKTCILSTDIKSLKISVPDTLLLETNQEVMFEEDSVLKPWMHAVPFHLIK